MSCPQKRKEKHRSLKTGRRKRRALKKGWTSKKTHVEKNPFSPAEHEKGRGGGGWPQWNLDGKTSGKKNVGKTPWSEYPNNGR